MSIERDLIDDKVEKIERLKMAFICFLIGKLSSYRMSRQSSIECLEKDTV